MDDAAVMGLCSVCGAQRFGGREMRYGPALSTWVCLNCMVDWLERWEIQPDYGDLEAD